MKDLDLSKESAFEFEITSFDQPEKRNIRFAIVLKNSNKEPVPSGIDISRKGKYRIPLSRYKGIDLSSIDEITISCNQGQGAAQPHGLDFTMGKVKTVAR